MKYYIYADKLLIEYHLKINIKRKKPYWIGVENIMLVIFEK